MTIQTPTSELDAIGATPEPALPDERILNQWASLFFSSLSDAQSRYDEGSTAVKSATVAGSGADSAITSSDNGFSSVLESVPPSTIHHTASLAAAEDWVNPRAFGLPGSEELVELLREFDSRPRGFQRPASASGTGFYFLQEEAPPSHQSRSFAANSIDSQHLDSTINSPSAHEQAAYDLDIQAIRRDFPILNERVNGRPLIWLDNAATTQKPQAVIDRLAYFYHHENSNVHRAAHELAARATDAYETARNAVARFIGAGSAEEIVFVRGATEAINLVAKSWGRQQIQAGDEIIVSHLEHHANIVPWQQLIQETGAVLRVIPVDDSGQILIEEYYRLLCPRTKLVAITHVSNALGTIAPVGAIIAAAHSAGARVLVDGAQSVSHLAVDVRALDADFFAFSGHKIFGPTGIGVLYGKKELLDSTPPWQGGGNMIADVTFERTRFHEAPARFEAGTGNIADAVGLGAALEYVERIGLERIAHYEHQLLEYALQQLGRIPGLRLIGTAKEKTSVISFVLEGFRTEEVGQALNREGIAVRSGHHCAQPILRRFGVEATVRPSLAFYNTRSEIDCLEQAIRQLVTGRPRR